MRTNQSRYLAYLFKKPQPSPENKITERGMEAPDPCKKEDTSIVIPPEFNAKDWLTYLIHVDAELEHGLMVQYLYAAYSMGGPHITDEKERKMVREWQEIVLGVAKEEMGHFVSVQNVLRVMGAPLNFERQDYPWDTPLYPFPFKLEPFSLESLAKYVFAESPANWLTCTDGDDKETIAIKEEIEAIVQASEHGDPISVLFEQILKIIEDPELIPDDVFLPNTYPYQAKFDEWGRGYKGGNRGNTTAANPAGTPDVLVEPLMSRDDAISALKEIAEQGEGIEVSADTEASHFERFLGIYKVLRKMPEGWKPSRNVATNPTTDESVDTSESPSEGLESNQERDLITDEESKLWAHLFNTRYRMLLNFLTHSFLLDGGYNNSGDYSPRGTIIGATFGEMYNLRGIASLLVQMPLGDGSSKTAGPPFLVPYTMNLPTDEASRWRLHQDVIDASARLVDELLEITHPSYKKYLYSLKEADTNLLKIAKELSNPTVPTL